jgi:N-acyl homoserine lactone hydrolase
LGERDIHPSDVTMVINTHLHFDHAGYNREFDSARFVSQGREIEYALAPDRFQKGGYLKENFESCRFESIEGETEVAPGITVLPTPGHTPGHQSVLIEQKDRTTIYTGDVSPLPVNLEKMLIVGVLHDPVAALQSLNILKDISHGDRQKRFIFSHD